ncbi:MAG: rhamnulokinase, partial [Verrucomicrobia bacterium]
MENKKVYLSIDLGASSGRVMAGQWDGSTLRLSEVHRFPTPSVFVPPYHYWDILAIYSSILHGLNTARQAYGGQIVSIGVDSWGVDYALIDANGEMLANPIQYRDGRTREPFATLPDRLGRERI